MENTCNHRTTGTHERAWMNRRQAYKDWTKAKIKDKKKTQSIQNIHDIYPFHVFLLKLTVWTTDREITISISSYVVRSRKRRFRYANSNSSDSPRNVINVLLSFAFEFNHRTNFFFFSNFLRRRRTFLRYSYLRRVRAHRAHYCTWPV